MELYNSRNDVPEKYKWDLSDYFQNEKEFLKKLSETKKKIDKISSFVGCTKDSKRLIEYLIFDRKLITDINDLGIYATANHYIDWFNDNYTNYLGFIDEIEKIYSMESSFFKLEILNLSKEEYEDLFKNSGLQKYRKILDIIYRKKEHIISESEERIVAALTETLNNYNTSNTTLINGNHDYGTVTMEDGSIITLTTTNYFRLVKKIPRDKRKALYEQLNKVKSQYASTNASFLNNYVKIQNALSSIYNYDSSWERYLFNNNLSSKIFDTLVEACKERKNAIKQYEELKAKVLGVDKLMPLDDVLEFYKIDKDYTIEDMQEICLKAISILGEEYVEHFKKIITDKCVDYCQYKGKTSNSYNIYGGTLKNSKILMSFNGDLESISTFAHECGHHVHHQYVHENNESFYRSVPSMVSEVAALTNECLLSNYLINYGTKEEALAGLSNLIDIIKNNLFDATYEGEIERIFHKYVSQGGTITSEYMRNLQKENYLEFMPYDDIKHEYQLDTWLSIPHYYMFFYTFNYAVCISCATYIASEIINGNKEILEKYKKFLSTGSDKDIIETFKVLDIDLESKEVYMKAIDYFEDLLHLFEKKYDEVIDRKDNEILYNHVIKKKLFKSKEEQGPVKKLILKLMKV